MSDKERSLRERESFVRALRPDEESRLQGVVRAAKSLRVAATGSKNQVLLRLAAALTEGQAAILAANALDLDALPGDATSAFRDRLTLTPARVAQMAESLRQVAALPDPVTEEIERRRLTNGILARRVRSPLGVIFMIFESRPNVAIEAFSLAFKAGNACVLRGGKESAHTTGALFGLVATALQEAGLPEGAMWGITDPDRELVKALLQRKREIDVVVPRGGERLIAFIEEHSRIPIIKNDRGMCHVYLHEDAEAEMAVKIVANAKTQRPGVCNAMETLLVHRSRVDLLPRIHEALIAKSVEWRADETAARALAGKSNVVAANPEDWDTEHLDYRMNCRVVPSLDEAIAHVEAHGSRHSEAIVTRSEAAARRFQAEVDAAAVYWNASTRFTDGFELGLGGELGISTQKLHVRGPVGLRELTSARWVLDGTGQVRG